MHRARAGRRLEEMRLATFNILHGRSPADGEVNLGRFATAVAGLGADVLALQEVDRDQPRSHQADLTAVAAEAMGASAHRFVATLAGEPGVWTAATGDLQPATAAYGIALVSRFPVRAWLTTTLPALPGPVPVTFQRGHAPTLVHDEPRAALSAVVDGPGGLVEVIATHLTFVPGWNAYQLRRLVKGLGDHARPVVIMGDLNLAGSLPARLTGWQSLAAAPTWPAPEPTKQLDHILADGGVRALGDGVARDTGLSDHRALWVDVTLS